MIVHDGNRPLVTAVIISDNLVTFAKNGSAVAVVPCTDIIFESDNGFSSHTSTEREKLFHTQSPHTYHLNDMIQAHEKTQKRGIKGTAASCTLMKELGHESYFSKGSGGNINNHGHG